MANRSEDIQCVGSDTRPPMLDRTDFEFREILGVTAEGEVLLGPERDRTVADLTDTERERRKANDNVKMLLEGSELSKDDHESQLYDDFEHFRQKQGENINEYYVTDNQEKDKIEAKTDKTEHGNGKSVKRQSQSKVKAKKSSSQRKYNFRD
ncbi:hypothetical protein Tco_0389640 [Tanacetum coccineum]